MNHKVNYAIFGLIFMLAISGSNAQGPNRPGGRFSKEISPAIEKEILQVLEDMRPDEYARILPLKETQPVVYRQELKDLLEKHQRILMIKRHDPEQYQHLVAEHEMDTKTLQLAKEIQFLPEGSAKQEKIAELKTILYDLFEQRQFNRKQEIARLEEKLQELKTSDQQREEKKDEIVEKRLNELLNQQEDLEW